MDNLMENIDWQCIHFNELDILLLVSAHEKSVLNEPLINGLTPLCLACKFEREDLVTILLHHGARTDICASNCGGKYPLHFACDSDGNRGVVLKLLKAKADINAQDNDGNTALHLTCKKNTLMLLYS
uniref:Uncharacterized protein n=1 Tax=Arion vulgaris TaxID=1028688 RepID=A0A0B6Z8Z6_9EUPU